MIGLLNKANNVKTPALSNLLCLAIRRVGLRFLQRFTLQKWKGALIQRELLGVPHFGRKSPSGGVKYEWILLANGFIQAISEKSICTHFEGN